MWDKQVTYINYAKDYKSMLMWGKLEIHDYNYKYVDPKIRGGVLVSINQL